MCITEAIFNKYTSKNFFKKEKKTGHVEKHNCTIEINWQLSVPNGKSDVLVRSLTCWTESVFCLYIFGAVRTELVATAIQSSISRFLLAGTAHWRPATTSRDSNNSLATLRWFCTNCWPVAASANNGDFDLKIVEISSELKRTQRPSLFWCSRISYRLDWCCCNTYE